MKISVFSKLSIILCLAICISLMVCACGSNNAGSNNNVTEEPPHTHSYVNGLCECGTIDPSLLEDLDKPNQPEKNTVTYTVTVVDQDGAPVVGAAVQLCVGNICRLPSPTDANGVAVFDFEPADYSVKVTVSGYTCEDYYYFDTNSTELNIVLTKN